MQLILIMLAAFGLGYWFANSSTAERLAKTVTDTTSRLRTGTKTEKIETNEVQS